MTDASLRFLVDHCPFGLSQHQASGVFVAASRACEALFGRTTQELIGQELASLVMAGLSDSEATRYRDGLLGAWSDACATRTEQSVRFPYVHPDGRRLFLEVRIQAVSPGPAGLPDGLPDSLPDGSAAERADAPLQILCCTRDVTAEVAEEQARAERLAAAELAERHRDMLVQMTPGLVWYGPVSPDLSSYRVAYMSEYLFRVTGYTAQQWLETPGFWPSIIHPEDRERIVADAGPAMREGRPIGPYRIRSSDGRILWIRSQVAIERDSAGVPVRMFGLTLDMTSFQEAQEQRMALQQALAEQAQRLLEVSTPLIPVSEDALVMPLIGTLDPTRAQHVLSTLLEGISALRVRYVLVDLTGVTVVENTGAAALLKMNAAARLLGARIILTGMRAEVARLITTLQVELTEMVTRPSLRAAIAEFVGPQLQAPRPLPVRRRSIL